jgi:hypothetical protein
MRKRVVITLLVIGVMIGAVGVGWVFQPWKDRIDYHKSRYLAVRSHETVVDKVAAQVGEIRHVSPQVRGSIRPREMARVARHRDALIRLGYLETRILILSNRSPEEVMLDLARNAAETFDQTTIWEIECLGGATVAIVAPQKELPRLEQLVRKVDVPETGN